MALLLLFIHRLVEFHLALRCGRIDHFDILNMRIFHKDLSQLGVAVLWYDGDVIVVKHDGYLTITGLVEVQYAQPNLPRVEGESS